MRALIAIGMIFVLLASCSDEYPAPETFAEYDLPFRSNLTTERLYKLDEEIKKGTFGDIHSLIILRKDKIVFENYYSNYQRSDIHPVGATTQAIISTLVGVAFAEDSLLSTQLKIIDMLPAYGQYFDDVPQKDLIDLGDVMSNSSGLWWDEWTYPFGNEDNDAYQMTLSNDWVVKVLSTPMIREPGFEFNYNSGNGIIMAPILENITGVELEQYTKEKLFDPLSITDWKWERIPGDFVNASWGLHLRPIDMLKIGYLHLKQGIWNEEMLFNERWTSQSTRNRTDVSSFYRYGYFWWRFGIYAEPVRRLKQNDVFFSWGDGGQFIFVVPHLDLVIVSTAGNYASNDILTFTMFSDYIIDAVDDPF